VAFWKKTAAIACQRRWLATRSLELEPTCGITRAHARALNELAGREVVVDRDRVAIASPSRATMTRVRDAVQAYTRGFDTLAWFESVGADTWFDVKSCVQQQDVSDEPSLSLLVVGRRDVGQREVFDLTVPSSTSFVANGVAVHNCINYANEKLHQQVRHMLCLHTSRVY
jgi:hypothetical protein